MTTPNEAAAREVLERHGRTNNHGDTELFAADDAIAAMLEFVPDTAGLSGGDAVEVPADLQGPTVIAPGEERDCCKPDMVSLPRSYLVSWLVTLQHARTFIVSRQKMHPTGVGLYDDDVAQMQSALALNRDQANV